MKLKKQDVRYKSISLSKVVADWADELVKKKGFESNYSAYIADLIRRDWEKQKWPPAAGKTNLPHQDMGYVTPTNNNNKQQNHEK